MEMAVKTLEDERFEMSLLFASHTGFYARFGWRPVNRTFTPLTGAQTIACTDGFDISLFELERDLDAVAAIHESYSGLYSFTVARDEAHWRASLSFAGSPGEHFAVCRLGASIVAYARAIWFHGVPMVMEYGYARGPDGRPAMLALFRHLGEEAAGASGCLTLKMNRSSPLRPDGAAASILVTHTVHDPELEGSLEKAGCTLFHHQDNFFMWRLIDPARLAEKLDTAPEAVADRIFEMLGAPSTLYWTADRF
jgi:hypothetical protein